MCFTAENEINKLLEIKNISISYGGTSPVVRDFSMDIKEGEIVCIVGESGSGKTTVIRSILGDLPMMGGEVTSGDIFYKGMSIKNLKEAEYKNIRVKEISVIFQDCGATFDPIRTVGEQFVEFYTSYKKASKKEAWDYGVSMMKKVLLPENVMNLYMFQLSGGMRQRVGIAFAYTFPPALLVADEPTSALDVTSQVEIIKQIESLRDINNTSVIMITHNMALACHIADKIIVMKEGCSVCSGDRSGILSSRNDYVKELIDAVPAFGGKSYV